MARSTVRSLTEHLDEYCRNKAPRVTARTMVCERTTCARFAAWWDATRLDPRSMDAAKLDEFLYNEGGLSYKTRKPGEKLVQTAFNKELTRLTQFTNWLIIRGVLKPVIADCLKNARYLKAKPRKRIWLDGAQIHELVTGADDPWEKFILSAFVYTACREGELLSRRITDVRDDGKIDWFRHKTVDEDRLPIMPELDEAIREWLTFYTTLMGQVRGDWMLVPSRQRPRGRSWSYHPLSSPSPETIAKTVKKHVARVLKVDIEFLHGQAAHILRRSSARALYKVLLEAGHTDALEIVRDLLGHEEVDTTMIYIGVEPGRERRDAVLGNGTRWLTPDQTNVVQLPRLAAVGD